MKLVTRAAMKELDRRAIEELGIPSTLLMENAAAHVAQAAMEFLPSGGRAAVFAGSGNNGGDGVAAAAYLRRRGYEVRVFLVGDIEKLTEDTREMARRFGELGGEVEDFSPVCVPWCEKADVLIDAMFGTGLKRPLAGLSLKAVNLMNSLSAPTVAADIPSGVEADSGKLLGAAVQAAVTVTFSFLKPGLVSGPGAACSGQVLLRQIGIPQALLDQVSSPLLLVDRAAMTGSLPRRKWDAHKGDFGKILILAGSVGLTGAAELAAKAALRAGAGLVFLGVPEAIYAIQAVKHQEAMPFPLPCDEAGRLTCEALPEILRRLVGCDLCLAGPGLGRSPELEKLLQALVEQSPVPLILDADGINGIAANIDILKKAKSSVLLTPHEGEFCRISSALKNGDRLQAAGDFARDYGVTLVLKGPGTVTAYPDGRTFVNGSGGPALAKGGTGDVLAGMIAAFLAQKIPAERAVYLHGRAADVYAERSGEYSLLASDVIGLLPEVIGETFSD